MSLPIFFGQVHIRWPAGSPAKQWCLSQWRVGFLRRTGSQTVLGASLGFKLSVSERVRLCWLVHIRDFHPCFLLHTYVGGMVVRPAKQWSHPVESGFLAGRRFPDRDMAPVTARLVTLNCLHQSQLTWGNVQLWTLDIGHWTPNCLHQSKLTLDNVQ